MHFKESLVMSGEKCIHSWEMVNVAKGLIITKKCFHCNKVSCCFIFHDKPPLESSHEGDHFWNFMGSDPALHFDLKCTKCDILVKMDELVDITMCTGCDETCKVNILKQKLPSEYKRVYIALGCRPIDERKQLTQEKFTVLEDFFHQQSESSKFRVKIVPHNMIKSIDDCYAGTIDRVDMLFTAQ